MLSLALSFERTQSGNVRSLEPPVNSHDWKNSNLSCTGESPALSREQQLKSYGKLSLAFEANQGQIDHQVQFLARGSGYGLFLTSTEAVLALRQPAKHGEDIRNRSAVATASVQTHGAVLRMSLVGASTAPQAVGLEELPGKVNYFIGNDPTRWRADVPTYARVKYQDVYPGVDMIYYGNQRQLEYDLVVAPGTDPDVIALRFAGSKTLSLSPQGDLVQKVAGGEVVLRKPNLYQEVNGARRAIQGAYELRTQHRVGFQIGDYDTTRPLVIDPVLVYSTYLGGSMGDEGQGIAVDGTGNAYVTGYTKSTNFPTLNPFQPAYGGGSDDAFVAKLNPAGNALVYCTYLGGSLGDNLAHFGNNGNSIAVDGAGNAYVTGTTKSPNFPTVNAYQATFGGGSQDAFVAKLSPAGNALLYSTYLGGGLSDIGIGIAVDNTGKAYVAGKTESTNFPIMNAYQATLGGNSDAFVVKFNGAGNALVYSTYLGGFGADEGNGIAVDSAGNAFVAGNTFSPNFPINNPYQSTYGGGWDAFVTKLNPAGNALVYSTYLGGSSHEYGTGNLIAVDGAGSAYVTGTTSSTNFPVMNAYQGTLSASANAFVTKFNAAGNAIVYSTYLGGSSGTNTNATGIAVDNAGSAYITGFTSTNFPTVNPVQATYGGGTGDAFVTKFNAAGNALLFSTYLGGSGVDSSWGIAVDSTGSAYITGNTTSTNFPTVNPFQANATGPTDGFVAKIALQNPCVDPPNTTMVAWYPFDETTGTTAANLATGNSGTLINSPTHVAGKVAGALRFDGVNDYVSSPSTIVTNIGPAGLPQTCSGNYSTCRGDLSIDAWIKVDPTASIAAITITDKRSGVVPAIKGYSFFVYARNRLGLQLADGVGAGYSNYLSPIIAGLTGNWHHVAVTVSRQSSPTGIKWYDNGLLIGSSNPTAGATRYGSLVNNGPLRIGADDYTGGQFKGDIDEVEIFNRELTTVEVQGIFNAGASGKCK